MPPRPEGRRSAALLTRAQVRGGLGTASHLRPRPPQTRAQAPPTAARGSGPARQSPAPGPAPGSAHPCPKVGSPAPGSRRNSAPRWGPFARASAGSSLRDPPWVAVPLKLEASRSCGSRGSAPARRLCPGAHRGITKGRGRSSSLASPQPPSPLPPPHPRPKEAKLCFLKTFLLLSTQKHHNLSGREGRGRDEGMGVGALICAGGGGAGKPSPRLWRPLPHLCRRQAAGGRVGVEGAPSGALPFHALLPSLLIFLLGDPHLLESALGAGDGGTTKSIRTSLEEGGGGSHPPNFHPCRPSPLETLLLPSDPGLSAPQGPPQASQPSFKFRA